MRPDAPRSARPYYKLGALEAGCNILDALRDLVDQRGEGGLVVGRRGLLRLGDLRLLVMTSLVLADKLFDSDEEIERLRAKTAQGGAPRRGAGGLAPVVDAVAQRIEDLAARLESA